MAGKAQKTFLNERYLLDRGWGFSTSMQCWLCPRNGRALSEELVHGADENRLKNVALLIERGFAISKQSSKWVRKSVVFAAEALALPHEDFVKKLRSRLYAVPIEENSQAEGSREDKR